MEASESSTVAPAPASPSAVRRGPRQYRRRLRQRGPLAGLLLPAVIGLVALLLLRHNTQAWRGVAGFLLAIVAAPVLLVTGAPLAAGQSYALPLVGSAALWVLLGTIAARSATRTPVATWRDFWREFLWLAGGVWLGVVLAIVASNLILGGVFL